MIKLGCDPEGFLIDSKGDYIPAYGIIPGDKKNPYELEKGAVQVDGMALEFNIHPASTAEEFNGNINTVLTQINEMIHKVDDKLSIQWTPIAKFRQIIWDMCPEDNKVLGCDPDFDYTGQVNANPTNRLAGLPVRTAAGHIHIGWTDIEEVNKEHFDFCQDIAKCYYDAGLKYYTPETKEEWSRFDYYGSGGSWRPKKYGIELRSPSNLWVKNESTRVDMFNLTRKKFNEFTGL